MTNDFENLPMFFVAGIAVRTINKDGQALKDIGSLWQQFKEGNLAGKLDDRESDDLYCVYTDYESDHNDYYTAILGCKVSSIEYLPDGFTGKAIAAGRYAVFTGEGKFPANVGATWAHIWSTDLPRTYTADFDMYHINQNFEDSDVKVYVAVD